MAKCLGACQMHFSCLVQGVREKKEEAAVSFALLPIRFSRARKVDCNRCSCPVTSYQKSSHRIEQHNFFPALLPASLSRPPRFIPIPRAAFPLGKPFAKSKFGDGRIALHFCLSIPSATEFIIPR